MTEATKSQQRQDHLHDHLAAFFEDARLACNVLISQPSPMDGHEHIRLISRFKFSQQVVHEKEEESRRDNFASRHYQAQLDFLVLYSAYCTSVVNVCSDPYCYMLLHKPAV
ncbi:hypothetical protein PoB_003311700 [Plakobranchus ocellatus]|uniref:Uncharacterized protein n=1 Tax=Plakobranchus ocellatus TaxID=259542 RepID=A0AAV4AI77_9GAST|nr:hypothetical protein PoB_003311700 [Plakobranchus ocellatus]